MENSVAISRQMLVRQFNLPWWDPLFGTYTAQPQAGHLDMGIGLRHLQKPEPARLLDLLGMPFVSKPGDYSIGRRWSGEDE